MARLELPDDILQIIKGFSQPITRPDWRSLHVMPHEQFILSAAQTINRTSPRSVFEMITRNGFKYNVEYYNDIRYINYIYVPNGTTTITGSPVYTAIHVPFPF
jgi:hypothetical protein